jgi:hypothetical protein
MNPLRRRRRRTTLVTCPNCKGRSSANWPLGPCTICSGSGQTTPEKAQAVLSRRRAARPSRDATKKRPPILPPARDGYWPGTELEPDPALLVGAACPECEQLYGVSHLGTCSIGSIMLGAECGIVGFRVKREESVVWARTPAWAREATDRSCLRCSEQADPGRGWVVYNEHRGWLCNRCLDDGTGVAVVDGELVATVLQRVPVPRLPEPCPECGTDWRSGGHLGTCSRSLMRGGDGLPAATSPATGYWPGLRR